MLFIVLTIFIILLLVGIVLRLLYKNYNLVSEIHKFDEMDTWRTLAFIDDLTHVFNRNAYNKHISEIKKTKKLKNYWIILFDIDDFKTINDTEGHLAGDNVLKSVASNLATVFPSPKYNLYRIGGDEFAVIAKGVKRSELTDILFEFRSVFQRRTGIRISMGYSKIEKDTDASFKAADEMLYAVKTSRKSNLKADF